MYYNKAKMFNKNQNGVITELLLMLIIIGAIIWIVFTRVHKAQG